MKENKKKVKLGSMKGKEKRFSEKNEGKKQW